MDTSTTGARIRVAKRHSGASCDAAHRLRRQYSWLKEYSFVPGLVNVDRWLGDGYDMEVLQPLSRRSSAGIVRAIVSALKDLWAEPAPIESWLPGMYFEKFPACDALLDWLEELELVGYCATHGDPTFENALSRDGVHAVLVDPLPDAVEDEKVPSVRALDLGKLLQSGLGYEHVRAGGGHWTYNAEVFNAVRRYARTPEEWALACWCCALHVQRFIPYQTDINRERWLAWWPDVWQTLRSTSTEY